MIKIKLQRSLFAIALFLSLAGTGMADDVRIGQHADYGRIVIEHSNKAQPSLSVTESAAILTLGVPLQADLPANISPISEWVANARKTAPDRIEVAINPGVTPELKRWQDDLTVIDFVRNQAVQSVAVRSGKHPDFARIVLEQQNGFSVEIQTAGNQTNATVSLPIAALDDRIKRDLKPFVQSVRRTGTGLEFDMAPGTIVDHRALAPNKYLIDFRNGGSTAGAVDPKSNTAEKAPVAPKQTPTVETQAPATLATIAPSTPADSGVGGQQAVDASLNSPPIGNSVVGATDPDGWLGFNETELTSTPPKLRQAWLAPSEIVIRGLRPSQGFGLFAAADTNRPTAIFLRGRTLWLAITGTENGISVDQTDPNLTNQGLVERIRELPHPDATILRLTVNAPRGIEVEKQIDGWAIQFRTPQEPTRFKRRVIASTQASPLASGMPLVNPSNPAAGMLLAEGVLPYLTVVDPLVGDDLGIGLSVDHQGFLAEEFVDIAILSSEQGLVWQSLASDLNINQISRGVVFSSPGGLRLGTRENQTPLTDDFSSAPQSDTPTIDGTAPNDLALVPNEGPIEISQTKSELPSDDVAAQNIESAAAEAVNVAANDAGVQGTSNAQGADSAQPEDVQLPDYGLPDMAPFGIAGAYLTEASFEPGLINKITNPTEAVEAARQFVAMAYGAEAIAALNAGLRGLDPNRLPSDIEKSLLAAANYLMHRMELADTFAQMLDPMESDETLLWRTALDTAHERWTMDRDKAFRIAALLPDYPAELRARLGLAAARNALESGFADPAYVILNELLNHPLDPSEEWDLKLLWAQVLERDGAVDKALDLLAANAATAASPEQEAIIAFHQTMVKHRHAHIDNQDALAALEEQKLFWRGHPEEPRMLAALGDLTVNDGHFLDGIELWERAIARAENEHYAAELLTRIEELVGGVLSDAERSATALTSLILFNRYGDTIRDQAMRTGVVESLAQQLARGGFADVAAQLLDEHRGFILGGGSSATRVEVAAKQLAHGNPEAVFSTLPFDDSARKVEAKARLELGETARARELLADETSFEAIMTILDAYWQDGNYDAVRGLGETLLAAQTNAADPRYDDALLKVASSYLRLKDFDQARRFIERVDARDQSALMNALNQMVYDDRFDDGSTEEVVAGLTEMIADVRQGVEQLSQIEPAAERPH